MQALLLVARWFLAAVFALAGVTKIADRAGTSRSLIDFGVPASLVPVGAVLLPLAELLCALALAPAASAWWGAVGALALLGVFSVAIGVNLARGRTPDCHCFGQVGTEPIGSGTLVRNAVLSAIAVAVLWLGPGSLEGASMWQVLAIVNGAVAAVLAVALFHVLRRNGRLLLRLDAAEAGAGTDHSTNEAPAGLPVGEVAPNFTLRSLDDRTVTLASIAEAGKRIVLVFSEPTCSACDEVLPDVARWQRSAAGRISTMVISRGTVEQNLNKKATFDLRTVLLQHDRETETAYGVEATPSAVLIAEAKVASPLAIGHDAIRRLIDSATQVVRGERAPQLQLVDLAGARVDLSQPTGRTLVLLFWNPGCGYCQELLPRIRSWECADLEGKPALLVISTGSVDANLEQGFASQVLLDPQFDAGTVFGASGTPAAVILDRAGHVASGIVSGSDAVLSLLNLERSDTYRDPLASRL